MVATDRVGDSQVTDDGDGVSKVTCDKGDGSRVVYGEDLQFSNYLACNDLVGTDKTGVN